MIHWWTSGGESAAVKQLAEAYTKAGGQWVDNAIAGGDNARAAALNRIAGGNPPTASQFNTSKQYHELIEADLLNNVDDVAAKEGWEQWMPTPIKNVIKVKGHYYAVPVNIHSAAWFWYSKAVLAKAGVAEPKNEAEFWTALDKIKASGQIAFAQSGTLTYERGTFSAVLLHMGGRDLYMKFYGDKDGNAVKSAEFRAVIEKFKSCAPTPTPALPAATGTTPPPCWSPTRPASRRWATGPRASSSPPARRRARSSVASPAGARRRRTWSAAMSSCCRRRATRRRIAAQQLMAKVITSPATQVAFNVKKGSIPIRPDVDASGLDACAQAGVIALKDPARQTPDPSMLMAPDIYGKVADVITKLWNTDMKPEDAQTQFAAAINSK